MTRRYAIAGLGHRPQLYVDALLGDWSPHGRLTGFLDTNATRMAYYNALLPSPVPTHSPSGLPALLADADALIVTTPDATHAGYVCAALEAGVDVICEKPLTTTSEACTRIAEAAAASSAQLTVTFNYRYSPRNAAVRALLASGRIGDVTAVHFEWLLDTIHGADYFRRWHRLRDVSGGLLVHKSTHHFDLVNWWLGSWPELVFAQTGLRFYGEQGTGGSRPARSHGAPGLGTDPFLLDIAADPRLKALYLDAEHEDGYLRDQDVFSPGITIDDTMSVLVRYGSGAVMTYSLNAYSPREGYRVSFTGTKGRIDLEVTERAYASPRAAVDPTAAMAKDATERLTLQQHWSPAEDVPIDAGTGGHGGGDALMLDDLFRGPREDPLGRPAGYRDGIRSVLTGVAATRSARSGQPVTLTDEGTRLC
jgi:predicted dehydrogenase